MIATTVISSIIVLCDIFITLRDVITIKQIPKRLDEAFKIWVIFRFESPLLYILKLKPAYRHG